MAVEDGGDQVLSDPADALAEGADGTIPPAMRLQILTTEHWSLLATRGQTWNEAFSRAQMFLSALSGGIVALALAPRRWSFGAGFIVFALLLLPVLLFLGIATFVRLVEINNEDHLGDRHEHPAPRVPGRGARARAFLHQRLARRRGQHHADVRRHGRPRRAGPRFVTTPGVIAVIDGVLAGILAAIAMPRMGMPGGYHRHRRRRRGRRHPRGAHHLPVPRCRAPPQPSPRPVPGRCRHRRRVPWLTPPGREIRPARSNGPTSS